MSKRQRIARLEREVNDLTVRLIVAERWVESLRDNAGYVKNPIHGFYEKPTPPIASEPHFPQVKLYGQWMPIPRVQTLMPAEDDED